MISSESTLRKVLGKKNCTGERPRKGAKVHFQANFQLQPDPVNVLEL